MSSNPTAAPIAGKITAGIATAEQVIAQIMEIIGTVSPQIAAVESLFGVASTGILAGVANLRTALEKNPVTTITDAQRSALKAEMQIIEAEDLTTVGATPTTTTPPVTIPPAGDPTLIRYATKAEAVKAVTAQWPNVLAYPGGLFGVYNAQFPLPAGATIVYP
jgi:hypothetical protein